MTRVELQKEWETRVTAFRAIGQSTIEWCAYHNLRVGRLRYWLLKFNPMYTSTAMSPQWMSGNN